MQTRRERVRQAAIEEIKSLAWDIAHEKGIEDVTIHGITKQMGMTPQAFYSYFKSRDALMKSLLLDTYKIYQQEMEAARDSIPKENFADRIMVLFLTYRKWAIANPAAFGFFAGRLTPGFYPPDKKILKKSEKSISIWQSVFYAAWEKGVLKLPDHVSALPKAYQLELDNFLANLDMQMPEGLVHTIIHLTVLAHGFVSLELSGRFHYLADLEQLYTHQILLELKQIGIEPDLTSLARKQSESHKMTA